MGCCCGECDPSETDDLELADEAREEGRREGYAESLRWVDHYLAMDLMVSPRAVLEEVRRRIASEAEHGKLTSVAMGGHVGAAKGGCRGDFTLLPAGRELLAATKTSP